MVGNAIIHTYCKNNRISEEDNSKDGNFILDYMGDLVFWCVLEK